MFCTRSAVPLSAAVWVKSFTRWLGSGQRCAIEILTLSQHARSTNVCLNLITSWVGVESVEAVDDIMQGRVGKVMIIRHR